MNRTILLVRDDPSGGDAVSQFLREQGYTVVSADGGDEAGRVLAAGGVDLMMVDSSGVRACDWIAARRAAGDATPAVIVMGALSDPDAARTLASELHPAIVTFKPLVLPALVESIESLMTRSPGLADEDTAALIETELRELAEAYGRELPAKLEALSAAISKLEETPADGAHLGNAIKLSHRLRGTAGSYGYHATGQTCGEIEDLLRNWNDPETRRAALGRLMRAAREAGMEARVEATPMPTTPSMSLLVADEAPAYLESLEDLAKEHGIRVVTVRDEAQAERLVADGSVVGAIIDADLGGQGRGIELAHRLRSIVEGGVLPLILLAREEDEAGRIAAIHAGASRLLGRPPVPGALLASVQNLMGTQRSSQPHVLLVDDDTEFAFLTRATLEAARMRVTWIDRPSALLETLSRENPQVLLLDVNLPAVSGFDLCRMLRRDPRWRELSILFLTARTDVNSRVAAFEVGADDYIPKPVVALELLARIRARLERSHMIRDFADRDALTGLYLRRRFSESLNRRLHESRRTESPLSLALLDVDHFKLVNDRYGHLGGDAVLARLGRLLSMRFRTEDLRGRWGGEEFVLVFPGIAADIAARVVTRVLEEFRELEFEIEGAKFRVTFSSGVAASPEDGATQDELVHAADLRLYQAKKDGRNRVRAV